MVPSVDNENVAGRTGATAPYFANAEVTYECATGYTSSVASIVATCTTPPTWTPPANADTVCRPGKTYFFITSHFAKRAQNHNESCIDCRGFRLNKIVISNNLYISQ